MSKYKTLKDITVYNYDWSYNRPQQTTVRYIIPAGYVFAPCSYLDNKGNCVDDTNDNFTYIRTLYDNGDHGMEYDISNVVKVDDSTALSDDKTFIQVKDLAYIAHIPGSAPSSKKSIFTTKNIFIAIVGFLVIFGILKLTKVI